MSALDNPMGFNLGLLLRRVTGGGTPWSLQERALGDFPTDRDLIHQGSGQPAAGPASKSKPAALVGSIARRHPARRTGLSE